MTKNQFWKGSTFFVLFSFDLTQQQVFFWDPFPKPGRQTGRNLNHHGFYTVRIVVLHSAYIHKILFAKDVKSILTVNFGRKYDQTVINCADLHDLNR